MLRLVFPAAHRRGGVERVVWEHARWFGSEEDVEFVGYRFDDPELVERLRLTTPAAPRRQGPRALRQAMASAVDASPRVRRSISFGVNSPPSAMVNVGSVHRRWVERGGPVQVGRWTIPPATRRVMPRHRTLLDLERRYFLSSKIERFVAVSSNVAEDLAEFYKVGGDRIAVVPNGFSDADFNLARRDGERESARRALGLSDHHVGLLFVANELHRKGFGPLLRALAASSDERLQLDVVGAVDPRPYVSLMERLGVSSRVRFHGPTGDVARFMCAADLFVLPTQYEAFGLVLIEALACGLPVITSRDAGASHAVEMGRNGYLLESPHDVEELTALLGHACERTTLERLQQGAAGSVDHLTWDRVLPRVRELLDELT